VAFIRWIEEEAPDNRQGLDPAGPPDDATSDAEPDQPPAEWPETLDEGPYTGGQESDEYLA
jgi:hypothetical protein